MKNLKPQFSQECGLQEGCLLEVNYAMSLEDHFKILLENKVLLSSHYREATLMLPDKKWDKRVDRIFSLVHFPADRVSVKSIVRAIHSVGWEPADYHEISAFVMGYPDLLQIAAPITALGSLFKVKNKTNYALFFRTRKLGFRHATDLIANSYYLVVKNEAVWPIL